MSSRSVKFIWSQLQIESVQQRGSDWCIEGDGIGQSLTRHSPSIPPLTPSPLHVFWERCVTLLFDTKQLMKSGYYRSYLTQMLLIYFQFFFLSAKSTVKVHNMQPYYIWLGWLNRTHTTLEIVTGTANYCSDIPNMGFLTFPRYKIQQPAIPTEL